MGRILWRQSSNVPCPGCGALMDKVAYEVRYWGGERGSDVIDYECPAFGCMRSPDWRPPAE